jgi:hypothetical protein
MNKIALACFLSLLSATGWAADLKPWYTRYLEIEPTAAYVFQTYPSVSAAHGSGRYHSDDNFLTLSAAGAYDRWSLELETTFAATHHRSFGFCDVCLTGRYQWLDDVIGDPVSLVTGLTVIHDSKIARNDISCFYHGQTACEFHMAAGHEMVCEEFWASRLWGVLGLGIADQGSPWIQIDAGWDCNWLDVHEMEIELRSLWGLGTHALHVHRFHGYGPIRHQSIDLGFNYHYYLESGGILGIGYYYRLYALNCPRQANILGLSFLYPFGL